MVVKVVCLRFRNEIFLEPVQCVESLEGWIRSRRDKVSEVDRSVTQIGIRDFLEFNEGDQVPVTLSWTYSECEG